MAIGPGSAGAAVSQAPDRRAAERAERLEFFAAAARQTPIVAVRTRAGSFLVPTSDEVVGRSLFVKRARGEMATLRRALAALEGLGADPRRDGRWLVDVGANLGTTCIPALVRHGFAGAIAVEPAPDNHRLLRANLQLNDVADRVRTPRVALSDAVGEAELALSATNSGDHRLAVDRRDGEEPRRRVRVARTTLDELLAAEAVAPERVGMLWIDAQGHEGHVLAGARGVLAAGIPVVFELWPRGLAVGGLERLIALIGDHYTHVVDLRAGREGERPVAELPALARAVGDGVGDLLAVRLP